MDLAIKLDREHRTPDVRVALNEIKTLKKLLTDALRRRDELSPWMDHPAILEQRRLEATA